MKLSNAAAIVAGIPRPHIPARRGRFLYGHISDTKPKTVLEPGGGRGGSAIFITAALQENGSGQLVSVDSRRTSRESD